MLNIYDKSQNSSLQMLLVISMFSLSLSLSFSLSLSLSLSLFLSQEGNFTVASCCFTKQNQNDPLDKMTIVFHDCCIWGIQNFKFNAAAPRTFATFISHTDQSGSLKIQHFSKLSHTNEYRIYSTLYRPTARYLQKLY